MTCIVGAQGEGVAYIGGDSAAVASTTIQTLARPKVFRVGEVVIGYTLSFRMGQLLQYHLELVDPRPTMGYMVRSLIPAVRHIFKHNGWGSDGEWGERGGVFMLALKGQLFEVNADYQVLQFAEGYSAIGSGQDYALGSLATTANRYEGSLSKKVGLALYAAARHSTEVGPPFTILESRA